MILNNCYSQIGILNILFICNIYVDNSQIIYVVIIK